MGDGSMRDAMAADRIDLVQGDTGPPVDFQVVRVHPTAGPTTVDLTGASVTWIMRLQATTGSGALVTVPATAPAGSGASAGLARITSWPSGALATAGRYHGQLIVALTDGTVQTAPPDDPYLVVVKARV